MLRIGIVGKPPLLAKSIARVMTCGGAEVEILTAVPDLEKALGARPLRLICSGVDQLDALLPLLAAHPQLRLLLLVSEEQTDLLRLSLEQPAIQHIFGLRYPEAPPRPWELLSIVQRWTSGRIAPRPIGLDWGAASFERLPATDQDRDVVVGEVERFVQGILGERMAGPLAEVAHELLMNAMYDAPVDAQGRALYANQRTASISLPANQRPAFTCGCDGSRLVLSVRDPFGRLRREHVIGGIHRGLSSGTMDRSGGGAGLGFLVIHRATSMIHCDVVPGIETRVTAILELDIPTREFRTLPRSIHFFTQDAT